MGIVCLLVASGACRSPESQNVDDRPCFVTTIHPFTAILGEVVGSRAGVAGLLPAGASPHTYDPRPSDVRRTSTCLAVLYGAPSLDGWAAGLSADRAVALLDLVPPSSVLPALDGDDGHGSHPHGADPHFWTDPLAVKAMLPRLTDTLCTLDAAGCTTYRTRADTFSAALDELHEQVRELLAPVQGRTVMLGQPFFQYFFARYGLTVAAVVEPIPGAEPSPRRVRALVDTARSLDVGAVFVLPQLPSRSAEAVAEAAGLSLHTLDPLGGVEGRSTYAELLTYNARKILEALR